MIRYSTSDSASAANTSRMECCLTNTVAAQIIDKLTPSVSFEYLTERMGFQLVEADRDYAPLALGQFTYGVTVREMAQAYTSFPNDGER